MPCKCTCGRDIDCGDTICPVCEASQEQERKKENGDDV